MPILDSDRPFLSDKIANSDDGHANRNLPRVTSTVGQVIPYRAHGFGVKLLDLTT